MFEIEDQEYGGTWKKYETAIYIFFHVFVQKLKIQKYYMCSHIQHSNLS